MATAAAAAAPGLPITTEHPGSLARGLALPSSMQPLPILSRSITTALQTSRSITTPSPTIGSVVAAARSPLAATPSINSAIVKPQAPQALMVAAVSPPTNRSSGSGGSSRNAGAKRSTASTTSAGAADTHVTPPHSHGLVVLAAGPAPILTEDLPSRQAGSLPSRPAVITGPPAPKGLAHSTTAAVAAAAVAAGAGAGAVAIGNDRPLLRHAGVDAAPSRSQAPRQVLHSGITAQLLASNGLHHQRAVQGNGNQVYAQGLNAQINNHNLQSLLLQQSQLNALNSQNNGLQLLSMPGGYVNASNGLGQLVMAHSGLGQLQGLGGEMPLVVSDGHGGVLGVVMPQQQLHHALVARAAMAEEAAHAHAHAQAQAQAQMHANGAAVMRMREEQLLMEVLARRQQQHALASSQGLKLEVDLRQAMQRELLHHQLAAAGHFQVQAASHNPDQKQQSRQPGKGLPRNGSRASLYEDDDQDSAPPSPVREVWEVMPLPADADPLGDLSRVRVASVRSKRSLRPLTAPRMRRVMKELGISGLRPEGIHAEEEQQQDGDEGQKRIKRQRVKQEAGEGSPPAPGVQAGSTGNGAGATASAGVLPAPATGAAAQPGAGAGTTAAAGRRRKAVPTRASD